MAKPKLLIIKTGYTEFLTEEASGSPSLGDVFRATCILSEFSSYDVTWLTSEPALPLLPGSPLIKQALTFTPANLAKLEKSRFDLVINLERCVDIGKWVEEFHKKTGSPILTAKKNVPNKLPVNGLAQSLADSKSSNGNGKSVISQEASELIQIGVKDRSIYSLPISIANHKPYQYHLFKAIGRPWTGQPYALPKAAEFSTVPELTVGFNISVGAKWPVKAWPEAHWQELAKMCDSRGISYSFQDGFDNLNRYFEWIHNHHVIVSNDSLGLHLALAMKKNVIGLFGPTRVSDLHFYGLGEGLEVESDCPKLPCFQGQCDYHIHCMKTISAHHVFEKLLGYVERIDSPQLDFATSLAQ